MKIALDGTPLTIPFPCGTKHYARQLIWYLAKIDKINTYYIFASKPIEIPSQDNFKFVKIPSIIPVLKRQLFLPFIASRMKLDVFHYLEPYGSIFFKHPRIVTTIHDLDLSYTYPLISKYFLTRLYCEITRNNVLKKTSAFITVSETVAKKLKNRLSGSKKNTPVHTLFQGVDDAFRVLKLPRVKKRESFLCMGDFAPRKNIKNIIHAYSLLPERVKTEHDLVIVASTHFAKKNFVSFAKIYNEEKRIRILVAVPKGKLIRLYNTAAAFLYPSLYEGFGIPILEAFACACPVITSDYGAMKEVAGKAAILVNPKSAKQISSSMIRIIEDNKLRCILIKRGLKRAEFFSWEKTAVNTLKIYERLYKTD